MHIKADASLAIATRRTEDLDPSSGSGAECSRSPTGALATACSARGRLAEDADLWGTRQWIGYGAAGALGVAVLVTALVWKSDRGSASNGPVFVAAAHDDGLWAAVSGQF
jgi:hypothetical protein